MKTPIRDCYWVEAGRLLAGEYPGSSKAEKARTRLEAFRDAGVTSYIDLTEEDEGLEPYAALVVPPLRHRRMPIRDMSYPSIDEMREILDRIDAELGAGRVVYVHCWGGHGRTGTVIGCWLVRHGLTGERALQQIRELRRGVPDADWHESPERAEQRAMVLSWRH